MSQREIENLEDNLLKPGEDPGEGYKGSPDMYPDYEEDKKAMKGSISESEKEYLKTIMPKMKYGGSSNKYKSGKFVSVKTKLGKTKPTKIC